MLCKVSVSLYLQQLSGVEWVTQYKQSRTKLRSWLVLKEGLSFDVKSKCEWCNREFQVSKEVIIVQAYEREYVQFGLVQWHFIALSLRALACHPFLAHVILH